MSSSWLQKKLGGGALYDLGISCVNASRAFFKIDPIEVLAVQTKSADPRFSEVVETNFVCLNRPPRKNLLR